MDFGCGTGTAIPFLLSELNADWLLSCGYLCRITGCCQVLTRQSRVRFMSLVEQLPAECPWNPATRYVMSRIPFDRDAITLSPPAARRLLREARFEVMHTDFLFFFPRYLSWLRSLEPRLTRLPPGAQYQILCRKPEALRKAVP